MIIAGIDPSLTSTGIAILADGSPVALRSIGHGTVSGKSYAHRSDRIVSQCRAVVNALAGLPPKTPDWVTGTGVSIDLAVIEGPAYGHANAYTHDGAGLWWGLYSTLRARNVPLAVVTPTTRCLFATGHGRAQKRDVLAAMREWFPTHAHLITNHDIADALALAATGAVRAGDGNPEFGLKQRQMEALDVVKWPSNLCAKPESSQVAR